VAVVALIEHARGNRSASVRLIEELEEVTRERPVFRARHLPEVLRVCVAAGAIPLAEGLLDTDPHLAARHRYSVLTGRAVLTEARGQHDAAGALYGEAAEHWADYGYALERGQAALGASRCLAAAGRHQEAAVRLTEARKAFDALRAGPLLVETDRALARARTEVS
jgi:hypothetical protein